MTINLRPAKDCHYDVLSLGEVMLRLDPGDLRIRTARKFDVWEGGGEYNVVRGLSRVFGMRTGILTALVDDEVGHLIEGLMLAGGVDTKHIHWAHSDGVGRTTRNGLNFTERGFGLRRAKGLYDRGHTAISKMVASDLDLDHIFGELGVRWLHTGGVFAALSEQSAETAAAILHKAKEYGTVVSYDLNYRPSMWKTIGGQTQAREVNRELARHVDVMIGNEEDFTASLGFEIEGVDENLTHLPLASFERMIEQAANEFPNFQAIGTTMRSVKSASINDWSAIAWSRDTGTVTSTQRDDVEIFDRVGGGDSFASGLIYGLMTGQPLQTAVNLGAAHGALAMTTPGDTSMVALADVLSLAAGESARADR